MGFTHPAGLPCYFVVKTPNRGAFYLCGLPFFLVLCKFLLTFSGIPAAIRQDRQKQGIFWLIRKKKAERPDRPFRKRAPREPCRPVITCTFTARWVASNALYHFQLPAADSSREACEPRADPASRITKCGLKKDLSRTPQDTRNDVFLKSLRGNGGIIPRPRQTAAP